MKHLNIPVTDNEYQALSDVKGDRSWHDALLDEFGADPDE